MTVPPLNDVPFEPMPRAAELGSAGPNWLLTFADLAALMVAFFALMFSMGDVDADRWNATEAAIEAALDSAQFGETARDHNWRNIDSVDVAKGLPLDYLVRVVAQQVGEVASLASADIHADGDRLVISLPQSLIFEPDGARLAPGGGQAIAALTGIVGPLANDVEIVGHTDPLPVPPGRWPSNWELSLTRAAVVAHELRRAGYAKPVRISGAGAGRFEQIDPQLPPATRYAAARRVDVVIRYSAGAAK
jgi:chemotaxis protein MotB